MQRPFQWSLLGDTAEKAAIVQVGSISLPLGTTLPTGVPGHRPQKGQKDSRLPGPLGSLQASAPPCFHGPLIYPHTRPTLGGGCPFFPRKMRKCLWERWQGLIAKGSVPGLSATRVRQPLQSRRAGASRGPGALCGVAAKQLNPGLHCGQKCTLTTIR